MRNDRGVCSLALTGPRVHSLSPGSPWNSKDPHSRWWVRDPNFQLPEVKGCVRWRRGDSVATWMPIYTPLNCRNQYKHLT